MENRTVPKSEMETTAINLARENWRTYAGCECVPEEGPKGKGHDLACKHKHVEVKGTAKKSPAFRVLTANEFKAAQGDQLFELWLITGIKEGRGSFHIIAREDIVFSAKPVIHWHLPLGKDRLAGPRAPAGAREK
jgi:hypothetical protein